MNFTETETSVAEFIEFVGVKFEAAYVGVKLAKPTWRYNTDEWRITLTHGAVKEVFKFFTGMGLRAAPSERAKKEALRDFDGLTEKDKRLGTLYYRGYLEAVEKRRQPQAPTVASVLHSLILDSASSGLKFDDWCLDLGYDPDSRAALKTHTACRKIDRQLHKLFTDEQIEALGVTMQDY